VPIYYQVHYEVHTLIFIILRSIIKGKMMVKVRFDTYIYLTYYTFIYTVYHFFQIIGINLPSFEQLYSI